MFKNCVSASRERKEAWGVNAIQELLRRDCFQLKVLWLERVHIWREFGQTLKHVDRRVWMNLPVLAIVRVMD